MVRYGLILFSFIFLTTGCNEFEEAVKEAKKDTPKAPKDNYIVLLDLSDRILDNNQQQVAKDLTVLKTIYTLFKSNVNSKDPTHLYYGLTDKLKVLVAPQRTTPKSIYDEAGQLRVELSSESPEKKAGLIAEKEKKFESILPELYRQAIVSKNHADYVGADIWKYFDEDLAGDLDQDASNTLFIITDGYLDFEKTEERPIQLNRFTSCAQIVNNLKAFPDWNTRFDSADYGLMQVHKKFPNLKVVLLEINPKQEWTNEYNLLNRIWGKWFFEMGINQYSLIKNDNINEVREAIEKFMKVKIAGKIEPASWTIVTGNTKDETEKSKLDGTTDPANKAEINTLTVKKKDELQTIANSNTAKVTKKKKVSLKPTDKKSEQVSFGPAY